MSSAASTKARSTEVESALKTVMSAEAPSVDELDRDVYASPIRYPV